MELTEGSDRAGVTCGGIDDEVRRRGSMLRMGAGRCRASPGVWAARLDSWWTWDGAAGVKEVRRSTAARKRGDGPSSPVVASGRNSRRGVAELGVNGFGDAPGASAKTLRGLVEVGVRRSGVAAAAQSLCAAGWHGAGGARFSWWQPRGGEGAGVRGGLKKGPAISACGFGRQVTRFAAGITAWPLRDRKSVV